MSLRDLKGRMPERSKWLLAEGAAKRNPRYRDAPHDAKNANNGFLGGGFRVFQTLFFWGYCSWGCAIAPPQAKSTRAIALGIQPFRLDTPATVLNTDNTNIAHTNTIMCKSVPDFVKICVKATNIAAVRKNELFYFKKQNIAVQ